jgi:Protein of unknown function (DUF1761)
MISIIVASIAAFAFGAFWYMSPIGKPWLSAKAWVDQENPKWQSGSYMAKMYGTSFVLTVLVAYVLSVFITIFGAESLRDHLYLSWLLCFGFVITTKFNDLIYTNTPPFWGKRAQIVFLTEVGHYLGMFTIIATVLYYL